MDRLALVLLYSLGQWRQIVAWFGHGKRALRHPGQRERARRAWHSGGRNYLATRQNKRWESHRERQFTLSDQTVKLLQGLKGP